METKIDRLDIEQGIQERKTIFFYSEKYNETIHIISDSLGFHSIWCETKLINNYITDEQIADEFIRQVDMRYSNIGEFNIR